MKLVAQDSRAWITPVSCSVAATVNHAAFPTGLRLLLDPAILASFIGCTGPDLNELVVFPRFSGSQICPMSEEAVHVHICLPSDLKPDAPLTSREWGILSVSSD